MADGELDLTLFNGAVRNSENEHVAKLLRQKSKLLVAFGSCAHMGGIPGLANLVTQGGHLRDRLPRQPLHRAGQPHGAACRDAGRRRHAGDPRPSTGGSTSSSTSSTSTTSCPGCPPAPAQVKAVAAGGGQGRAAAQGVGRRRVRARRLRRLQAHRRQRRRSSSSTGPGRSSRTPKRCLLEQGILCIGSATRSGCGVRCPNSDQGCRGCYGPLPDVRRPGRQVPVSAIASIIDSKDPEEIDDILGTAARLHRLRLPVRAAGIASCKGAIGHDPHDQDRPDHPARGPRQDRDLPRRRRRGEGLLLPDPRAARLRALRGRPAHRGAAAHRDPHLRRLPGQPPPGRAPRPWTAASATRCRPSPTSCARCTTRRTTSTATSRTSTRWPRPISSAARTPTRPCATSWAWSPRSAWRSAARSSRRAPWPRRSSRSSAAAPRTSVWCLPGGVSKGLTKAELDEIKPMVAELSDFADFSLQLFRDVVLGNPAYVDLILNGPYTLDVQNMGLVDANNAPNFYDGQVRVVDFEGKEICQVRAGRLRQVRGRARRAVDLPQVPVPEAARLEGLQGGHRLAASTARRRSRA